MGNENNTTQSKGIDPKTSGKIDKFVNMAFTDDNYDFIVSRTSELCVNFTNFINHIISFTSNEEINNFLAKNPWRKGKSSAPKRKGDHLKRIYEQNESSNTGIVNAIIENYRILRVEH